MEAENLLAQIANDIKSCQACQLANTRKNPVPGAGPSTADVMCIGEGPGRNEDEKGLPFVGVSGKFLTQLLIDAGMPRETVFITNVVKCRPPGNRDPLPDELKACNLFLEKQIEIIDPLIIVTLGRFSMARYFQNVRISQIHGEPSWHDGKLIVPMYHPAAALHQPKLRSVIAHDFAMVKPMIEKEKERRAANLKNEEPDDSASQLTFF